MSCKKIVNYGIIVIILFLIFNFIILPESSLGVKLRTTLELMIFIGISTYFTCKKDSS
jgi:hypothetical protein